MGGGRYDSSLVRVEPFFVHLLTRDASGRSWLHALLAATPSGGSRLGSLLESPGWLISPLAVPAASGRLACFEYPATPPRELLAWFIDHPGELVWPPSSKLSGSAGARSRASAHALAVLARVVAL